jgi:hypothetical protein
VAFVVFDVVSFVLVELVVELLVLLKPHFQKRRSLGAFLEQLPPPCWFLRFLERDIVFSNCLIFPI